MSIMTHALLLTTLDEYDKAFTIYLSLAEKKEDGMKEELKKCEQCSGRGGDTAS